MGIIFGHAGINIALLKTTLDVVEGSYDLTPPDCIIK